MLQKAVIALVLTSCLFSFIYSREKIVFCSSKEEHLDLDETNWLEKHGGKYPSTMPRYFSQYPSAAKEKKKHAKRIRCPCPWERKSGKIGSLAETDIILHEKEKVRDGGQ